MPSADDRLPEEPDIRFSLANERTFLAYERTATGLLAAALAVFHLIEPAWGQKVLGGLLIATSLVAAVGGWWRYHQTDRAIRAGKALPASSTVNLMALAMLALILVAGLSVVL